ncbi:MAG: FecR family protein [Bacteroidia bacterium]|nr:FecR family protein [Bacteroidia bacterium]
MNSLPENITHELIISYLKKETTNEESLVIEVWLNASVENKDYFNDLKNLWSETGKLNPAPIEVDVDTAWQKLSSRIESKENIAISSNNPFIKTLLKVAAIIIPAIAIISFYLFSNKELKQIDIVTTNNNIQKQLSDGSIININSHSKLTYPEKFDSKLREVNLSGEAFFEISPNKEKPFIIHYKDANVKVVGTSFNVNTNNNKVEVFVKTGKVLLFCVSSNSNDTNLVTLVAGDNGILDLTTKKAYKEDSPNENDIFWYTKTLFFDKAELSEVIEILQKSYNVNIVLKNKELNKLRLSTTFKDQNIESILDIISASFNLKVSKNNSTYEIDGESN